ncbi:MAG: DUF1207 domain-containing protein [Desulfococcaceae bacterium]
MKTGIFVLCLVLLGTFAHAAEDRPADATFQFGSRWSFELDPDDQPYPDYLADPRRMRLGISLAGVDSEIPETSAGRAILDIGTRYTLFKIRPDPEGDYALSLDIMGGVFMQFDLGNQLDNVGWEGIYGLGIVFAQNDHMAARIGYRHLSSHIGDEYIEKTGRERIGYTRDDLTLGLSYWPREDWMVYVEPRWAFNLGDADGMKELAGEAGVQYEGPRKFWNGNAAFYAGLHVQAYQESDWKPGVSFQSGLQIRRGDDGANIRLGLEGYTGRAILGEYALEFDESYLLCGFMLDFY